VNMVDKKGEEAKRKEDEDRDEDMEDEDEDLKEMKEFMAKKDKDNGIEVVRK
jgi:hypothetical protein